MNNNKSSFHINSVNSFFCFGTNSFVMNLFKGILLCLFFAGFFFNASAQWVPPVDCVDTNRINPDYICPYFEYYPRCGCDGNTYLNDCDMSNRGAVNYTQYDGPCEPLNFDIHPTLVADILHFSSMLKEPGVEIVEVYNIFGIKITEQNFYYYNIGDKHQFDFSVNNWEYGMYIIVASANGYFQTKKFVKSYTK